MHGTQLPSGLLESSALPEPVFTPSTKAEVGDHDENISFEQAVELVGPDLAEQARVGEPRALPAGRGVGAPSAASSSPTPSSSSAWSTASWWWPTRCSPRTRRASGRPTSGGPGTTPPSFDKQPVRDYLDGLDWDKQPPPPPLPAEVVAATRDRYVEAYERITGLASGTGPGVS